MKKYLGVIRVLSLAFAVSFIWGSSLCYAFPSGKVAPQVTKWKLTNPSDKFTSDTYLVMPNADEANPLSTALYITPGQSDSNNIATGTEIINIGHGAFVTYQGPSRMFGVSTGECFGMLLMSVTEANISATTSDKVKNYTNEFLGGEAVDGANPDTMFYGPANYRNFSSGLPVGTELEVTVDLNNHKPHFVGILGTGATIQYDATADTILITAKTVGAAGKTNFAGQVLTSYFGFAINSDTELFGTTPLRIIGQTDVWVGDFNLFMPGADTHSALGSSSPAGTWGSSNALCGFTAWGTTGDTRNASIFIPDDSLATIFGSGVTALTPLTGFVANSQVSTTVTPATNFGKDGQTLTFNYTFASGKDSGGGLKSSSGGSGSLPVGPLAAGISALLVWWKRRKQ